jgi:hypothetical protein
MSVPPEEPKKPTYEEFKAFYDTHPDLDNIEYYNEFPSGNKSTLRTWKNRARTANEPTPSTSQSADPNAEMQKDYIQLLLTQTNSKSTEFEGIDDKSKIILLKNRLRLQKEETPTPTQRTSNAPILPNPRPIGQSNKEFGIDPYIEFDKNLNEIRMEIPMTELLDPEKNKELRKIYKV